MFHGLLKVQRVTLRIREQSTPPRAMQACVYLDGEDGAVGPEELEQLVDPVPARQVAHEQLAWPRLPLRPAARILSALTLTRWLLAVKLLLLLLLPVRRRSNAARPLLLVVRLRLLLCFEREWARAGSPPWPETRERGGVGAAKARGRGGERGAVADGRNGKVVGVDWAGQGEEGMIRGGGGGHGGGGVRAAGRRGGLPQDGGTQAGAVAPDGEGEDGVGDEAHPDAARRAAALRRGVPQQAAAPQEGQAGLLRSCHGGRLIDD